MGKNDGVEPRDLFAQTLDAEFRSGIDDDFRFIANDVNRRAKAVVFWISEKFRWVFFADERNALRSARA
jgi:hypothetical protein